jgi:hypothetical protein
MNMSTPNDLTQAAKEKFLDVNRNLLAFTTNGPNDVFRRISAALALDPEAQNDVMMFAPLVDQKGYAGQVAREDFSREIYKAICKCFIRVQKNLVITFSCKLTPEAMAELLAIEVVAGVREAPAPIAPPAPPKSAQELLSEEVKHDWVHLRTAEVRRKCNNKAYKAEVDRLMAANELASVCTALHDGGKEFRS